MNNVWELSPQGKRLKLIRMSDNQWQRIQRRALRHRFELEPPKPPVKKPSRNYKREDLDTKNSEQKPEDN